MARSMTADSNAQTLRNRVSIGSDRAAGITSRNLSQRKQRMARNRAAVISARGYRDMAGMKAVTSVQRSMNRSRRAKAQARDSKGRFK